MHPKLFYDLVGNLDAFWFSALDTHLSINPAVFMIVIAIIQKISTPFDIHFQLRLF